VSRAPTRIETRMSKPEQQDSKKMKRQRAAIRMLAIGLTCAGLVSFGHARAQEEEEAEDRSGPRIPSRERILEEMEESAGDLFDFRPARDLLGEDEDEGDADLPEPPPVRSRRTPTRRAGTPVVPQSASRLVDSGASDALKMNFDGMDLLEFLQLMSEVRDDLNFIVHPEVDAASVTIKSSRQVLKADIPDVIQTVLEINALAAIPSGRYYKIVPLKDSSQYNVETRRGKSLDGIPTDDRLITQIVPLDHIPATELATALNDFAEGQGHTIVSHEGTNTLIISSSASAIRRMLLIVDHLDVPSNATEDNLYVYYLENADAETVAAVLNDLYDEDPSSTRASRATAGARRGAAERARARSSRNRRSTPQTSSAVTTEDERFSGATVVPYKDINALIVKTTPKNYENIKRTIALLDIPPKQVFIEMLVAEISLDDQSQLGVEWATSNAATTSYGGNEHTFQQDFSRGAATRDSASSVFDGFRYMISETNRLQAIVEARASESKLNVLASPNIVASDNKTAEIAVTDQVPVEQSTISEAGIERLTFQYKDAGIKLSITPNINEQGVVSLELEQEVSEISGSTTNGQPTFISRTAKTTVAVRDGQTLAIGGLIQESETMAHTGIPILSKIPILGYLFRSTSTRDSKTELVILITPHVITSLEDGDTVTRSFTGRLDNLRETVDQSLEGISERTLERGENAYRAGDQGAIIDDQPLEPDVEPGETPALPDTIEVGADAADGGAAPTESEGSATGAE